MVFSDISVFPHRQTDPVLFRVDGQDPDFDRLTDFQNVGRMTDVSVGNLRNMNESVLMDADIDESAEIDDVPDRDRQFHAHLQVVDIHDIRTEFRFRQTVADVPPRF